MSDTINNDGIVEKKVYEEVTKSIASLGENVTKKHDELMKSYTALKSEMNKGLEASDGRLSKFQEDILTRQTDLDKNFKDVKEKIDSMEVALKRPAGQIKTDIKPEDIKEVLNWRRDCLAHKQKVTFDDMKAMEAETDKLAKDYAQYKDIFSKFLRKEKDLLTPDDYKSLSVGVDPHGGYTVTPQMSNTIITRLYESDPIRQLAAVENISTDAIEWLVDWDEATVGWEGETETGAQTGTPDFKKKRIPVHIMYAKPYATQQLLEDSAINIESWLANKVADKMGRTEAAAFVTGDGIGKPRGFLTYSNGTTYGTIEQVAMGHASAITADGFVKIKYSLKEQFLNRGTWIMNRTTLRDAMLLKDGTGNYIWKPSMIAGDPTSSILSLPVRMSTTMPTIAANALSVVLADFRQAYMIVDRLGITVQRDPYTQKPFIEFYTRKRVGGDVINYDAIKIGKISA